MQQVIDLIKYMLSKNRVKFILSLRKKKIREETGLYVIEGDKLVREFLAAGVTIKMLIAKKEFIGSLNSLHKALINEIESASYEELKQISSLTTPHNALALTSMRENQMVPEKLLTEPCAVLDCIQDPGNLGTIIRAAAWFGIRNIVCSADSVDVYNPKVIQATMGAILHVNVYYSNLGEFVRFAHDKMIPVYGTLLEGKSIYDHKFGSRGIILLGNESKGISDELLPFVTHRIMIPGIDMALPGIESLNVGMAASIVFSEFYRKKETSSLNNV